MADNERVEWGLNDLPYGQLAPSQSSRTDWYPGKKPSEVREGDANWEKHYRIPVGVARLESSGPLEVERVRVVKLGRGIVCDQVIAAPVVTGTKTVTVTNEDSSEGPDYTYDLTQTETQDADGTQERNSGYDWAEGA